MNWRYTWHGTHIEEKTRFLPEPETEWWLHLKGKGNPEKNEVE